MFDRILVICAGNICRSPLAEYYLRNALPQKTVHSAGLVARNGMAADPNSIQVGSEHALDLSDHKARKINSDLLSQYDLILVMEPQHKSDLSARYPQVSGKTMLIGRWVNIDIIPDPHRQHIDAFYHAYQLLAQACDAWAARLK